MVLGGFDLWFLKSVGQESREAKVFRGFAKRRRASVSLWVSRTRMVGSTGGFCIVVTGGLSERLAGVFVEGLWGFIWVWWRW